MRHALSVSIAVLVAILVNYYAMGGMNDWLIWSAFLIGLPSPTVPLRERAIVLILMLAALSLAILSLTVLSDIAFLVVLGLVFILLAISLSPWQPSKNDFWLLSFLFVFMIALLLPAANFHDGIIGCIAGALIAMISSVIVPINFEREFSRGLLPSLQAMDKNLQGLQTVISSHDFADLEAKAKKLQRICLMQPSSYPEWVFNVGFNPGLRSSLRFFLIKLEQAQEVLCGLNYLVLRDLKIEKIQDSMNLIMQSMQGNRDLLHVLIHFFEIQSLLLLQQNFTEDIAALETAVQQVVPSKLELLDIAPDYLALAAFVRELKDLRTILLQLTAALPAPASTRHNKI